MKKHVLIATGLAVLSTSAYATKARMAALGQDTGYGSFYMSDSRNIFRNAAHVNSMKNYVVTEWGSATGADSTATAPAAEGGFFREAGAFAYGLYLGSDLESQNGIRSAGTGYGGSGIAFGQASALDRDNELDVFFAGDMGVEWGVHLNYASNKDETGTPAVKEKQSALGLGAGIVMGDLNAYLNMGFKDETENVNNTTGAKWESMGSMVAGVGYNWMSYTFFAEYQKRGAEFVSGSGVAKNETEQTVLKVGAGHVKEVSATSRMVADLHYSTTKGEDKDGTTATNNREQTVTKLPLTVGFETDATSWLTLRGSVSQAVIINNAEVKTSSATTKSTNANDTSVNAGATLNFGKLKVDGMIGTNGVNGTNTNAKNGVLDADRLLTQVAVHYWF